MTQSKEETRDDPLPVEKRQGPTPGPWMSMVGAYGDMQICADHGRTKVAVMPWHDEASVAAHGAASVDRANARLIAVAPELLALLREFVALHDCDTRGPLGSAETVNAFVRRKQAIHAAARAAVAKAEGR